MIYRLCLKRVLDFTASFVALILLSPLLLLLGVIVRLNLGSPVIFCQERPGKNEEIFKMYKFRSMTNKTDELGNLLPDDQRLTKFGKFLRASSLDELPELFNIFKGDMAIIGPRPLLVRYLPLYSKQQRLRHNVRPGLTGWAQVNGRNAISWSEKFMLDVYYIENISILLDIKIIFLTVKKVFLRDGIHAENSATMEEFKGNN